MNGAAAGLLAALLAGCGSAEPVSAPDPKDQAANEAGASADPAERSLAVGEMVEIRLTAQPGAGYGWEVASVPAGMEMVESRTEPVEADTEGAPEVQVFRFRAVSPGRAAIRFDYRRPWEKEKPARKSETRRFLIRD